MVSIHTVLMLDNRVKFERKRNREIEVLKGGGYLFE